MATKKPSTKKPSTGTSKLDTLKAETENLKDIKLPDPVITDTSTDDCCDRVGNLSREYQSIEKPDFVQSGSVVIDALLGGGIPRGVFILWSSASGIGKSTGSLYISRSYCVQGLKVLYMDFEGGVNESQLDGIGLSQYLYHPKNNPKGTFFCYRLQTYQDAEKWLDAILEFVDLVIIDSVTAMLPGKMQSVSIEDVQPGLQSRLMANLLLKYKSKSVRSKATWIMINQMRTHIRFVGISTEEEAGGNALKFYSDYRILMKEARNGKLEKVEKTARGDAKVPFGSLNEIWCLKSRYSRPFIPLSIAMVFGKGVSNNYAYKDFLESNGCIKRRGAWYDIDVAGLVASVNGEGKIVEWIQQNRDAIRGYVNSCGGYPLVVANKTPIDITNPDLVDEGEI
jgi:RecA/RadA recombinase